MKRLALTLIVLALVLCAAIVALNLRGESPLAPDTRQTADDTTRQRGAYLALAGNCAGCHTARGGEPYAGGRGIETPFGTIYATNLTPDAATGLGAWTADEFWRALHHGRSKDGRLLYPAFPYPSFTHITREDSDALLAHLRSLPPVQRGNTPHALRFPYDTQAALAVWRALYFRPASTQPEAEGATAPHITPEWQRGRYLVRGLGHCEACHASRNALGATAEGNALGGGLIPMQNWYAPSLASRHEAGVAEWQVDEIVALLKTGSSARGSVMGPMAEVVFRSTQHLSDADAQAMAVYLKSLPPTGTAPKPAPAAPPELMQAGAKVYTEHCADCHGAQGEGVAGAYPPLAGNRAVTLPSPNNALKAIAHGGFAPATAGNPRPHGMPPFAGTLDAAQTAAVATFIRQSWGQHASAVNALDVHRAR